MELYCGAGNLSRAWPPELESLCAVERDLRGLAWLEKNAPELQAKDVRGIRADLSIGLPDDADPDADTVLLDPPREGARAVVEDLAKRKPHQVIYVSCDPATLARDARVLAGAGYRAVRVAALDLFGATPHVETVLAMSLPGPAANSAAGGSSTDR